MSKMEIPAQSVNGHESTSTIVPAKAMSLIERTLDDADSEIQIAISDNDILIKNPRLTMYSRLLEGRFPKWRDAIPEESNYKIELPAGDMLNNVRQESIVSSEESKGMALTFSTGNLSAVASTSEIGDSHVEMPAGYEGDDVKVVLDCNYMIDGLRVVDPESTVTIEFLSNESSVAFRTDDGFEYVIMPLVKK